jgi:5'-phosphate synthase pdxT subunit
MIRLLKQFDVWDSLYQAMQQKPTWGICAGAILMAKHVSNPTQDSFGVIDISVTRNGYGRQLDSIVENIDGYPVSYIRAPIFEVENPDLIIKSTRDESPTWIIQGDKMVTSFHPELTPLYPSPMHSYFVQSINQ